MSSTFLKNPSFIFSAFAYTSCCRGLRAICSVGSFAPLWKNWETPHGIGLLKRHPLELCSLALCLYYSTLGLICQALFLRLASADSNRLGTALLSQTISALSRSLALSFCTLIVSHFKGFVKRFFELFCSVGRFCFTSPNYALGRGCSLLSASLHPYCIILWGICQGVFSCRGGVATLAWELLLLSPLDNDSIPYPTPKVNLAKYTNSGIQTF